MKYRIKRARGHYRVTRSMQGNMCVYTILSNGTTIGRITYQPVHTFASLFITNRIYNVWKTRPAFLPRFVRRCAE